MAFVRRGKQFKTNVLDYLRQVADRLTEAGDFLTGLPPGKWPDPAVVDFMEDLNIVHYRVTRIIQRYFALDGDGDDDLDGVDGVPNETPPEGPGGGPAPKRRRRKK